MEGVSQEERIVFIEGDEVRKLQGIIIREDEDFFYVKRNNGSYRIGKRFVIKTEPNRNGTVDNEIRDR